MGDEQRPYKRSLKNFILNPRMQLRISLYFVAFSFAATTLMMFVFYTQIQQIEGLVISIPEMLTQQKLEISFLLSSLVKINVLFFFAFIVASVVYGLLVSHRIAGPMYAILAQIEDLKKGNYDTKRKLREYDELGPVMDSLHELSNQLKNKK
jgi:nitrogen fixation/metabolism regulation signal transduction histidine kinase